MLENKNHQNCWFQPNCKIKEDGQCIEPICLRFEHVKDAFIKSGLTESQQNYYEMFPCNEDAPIYAKLDEERKTMGTWKDKYNSIYLWSHNYLNGKTTWAIKFIQYYIYATSKIAYIDFPRAYFLKSSELLEAYQIQYDNEKRDYYNSLRNKFINTELLVIDDIDFAKNNPKLQQFVGEIIDLRYSKVKPTIYTSHLSPDEFKSQCENKLFTSRIIDLSRRYEFCAKSYESGEDIKHDKQ